MNNWNPTSWRDFPIKQQPTYNDLEKEKFWFIKSYENGNAAAGEALKELNELSSN